jgi:uncharacterized protein YcsI (UPF0317 family)
MRGPSSGQTPGSIANANLPFAITHSPSRGRMFVTDVRADEQL